MTVLVYIPYMTLNKSLNISHLCFLFYKIQVNCLGGWVWVLTVFVTEHRKWQAVRVLEMFCPFFRLKVERDLAFACSVILGGKKNTQKTPHPAPVKGRDSWGWAFCSFSLSFIIMSGARERVLQWIQTEAHSYFPEVQAGMWESPSSFLYIGKTWFPSCQFQTSVSIHRLSFCCCRFKLQILKHSTARLRKPL